MDTLTRFRSKSGFVIGFPVVGVALPGIASPSARVRGH
jgi:hypothetical protein